MVVNRNNHCRKKPANRAQPSRRVLGAGSRHAVLLISLAALVVFWWTTGLPRAEESKPNEYEVKAAYLYNFGRFVEWPAKAPALRAPSFELCVLGKDPFGPALYKTVSGETIGGKYVVAKQVSSPQDAGDCREVFISSSEESQLAEILPALDEARTLTVSDMPEFVQRGGMIEFVSQSNRIRFQVNLTAAQRAGLTLSSQLLKVATKVIGTDASEK